MKAKTLLSAVIIFIPLVAFSTFELWAQSHPEYIPLGGGVKGALQTGFRAATPCWNSGNASYSQLSVDHSLHAIIVERFYGALRESLVR